MLNSKRVKVTLRDIAKMLCKALPLEQTDFYDKVEATIKTLKKLPPNARLALASAYVFSSKVPKQDREDLFQDITLEVLKSGTKDEPLAYSIARCDWRNWWEKRYNRAELTGDSLDIVLEDSDGNEIRASELLVGELEFEAKEIDFLDASAIWQKLPAAIRPIVQKRLAGKALTGAERVSICRFVKTPKAEQIYTQLATIQT